MKVVIAGYGYVGTALGEFLCEAGHQVVALRRSSVSNSSGKVQMVQADLTDPVSLLQLPDDVDAFAFMPSPDSRTEDAYRAAYVTGLSNLRARLPRAYGVLVTSTAVYHQTNGELVDDSAPALSEKFNAKILREAEDLHLQAETGLVLRASGIYGPGRTRLLSTLIHSDLPEEVKDAFTCRIHRDDLARAVTHALVGRPAGRWIASDETPATLNQMQNWARSAFATEDQRALIPRYETAANVRERSSRRLVPKRLLESGFIFRYPSYREGYTALAKAPSTA